MPAVKSMGRIEEFRKGSKMRESEGRKSPSGVRGKAPLTLLGDLRDEASVKTKQTVKLLYKVLR